MVNDNKGQLSLEFLMIFSLSLIILLIFTLPLAELAIENSFDLSDVTNVKFELSKISNSINQVKAEGQGSKKSIILNLDRDIIIQIKNNEVSTDVLLKDGLTKKVKLSHNCNYLDYTFYLNKGKNIVVIEWPLNFTFMKIYKK